MEIKDYSRVAAAIPYVRPTKIAQNLSQVERLFTAAVAQGAQVVVFPELSLTGATCGDMFFAPSLIAEAEDALRNFIASSADAPGTLAVVGLPVKVGARIYNCAAAVEGGKLKGIVPKSAVAPGISVDARWFAPASAADFAEVDLAGFRVPFGVDLIFTSSGVSYAIEIGQDATMLESNSAKLASAGANVILHLDATPEVVSTYKETCQSIAARSKFLSAGYVYASSGVGESSTDYSFAGSSVIAENGALLAEGKRFEHEGVLTLADVDVSFLDYERTRKMAFRFSCSYNARRVALGESFVVGETKLLRPLNQKPFVPSCVKELDERVQEVLAIQSAALATRLEAIACKKVVLGISGGLDSALALIVAVEAFKRLGLDCSNIFAFTMPGFGTSTRTKDNACKICSGFGVTLETINIAACVRQHFADIGHDESLKDITYENAQARARTYVLMDKANQLGALLIGTGDLSELALGWCTYNGDHMSMYSVNASVPKTLVRSIVERYAYSNDAVKLPLLDIVDTPVSPELLPTAADGTIAQVTEDKVGPYELHDFFIYHMLRRGASKQKIKLLAEFTFADKYTAETIDKWLNVFLRRFTTQQFKRNCMPDGPAVGSISLSPRGGWVMPSDIG